MDLNDFKEGFYLRNNKELVYLKLYAGVALTERSIVTPNYERPIDFNKLKEYKPLSTNQLNFLKNGLESLSQLNEKFIESLIENPDPIIKKVKEIVEKNANIENTSSDYGT